VLNGKRALNAVTHCAFIGGVLGDDVGVGRFALEDVKTAA
jgi:hypothetical protein